MSQPQALKDLVQHMRAKKALANAEAYVLVVYDGDRIPGVYCDIRACDSERDIRHEVMRNVAENSEAVQIAACKLFDKLQKERAEKEKVEKAKNKRTEELSGYADTGSGYFRGPVAADGNGGQVNGDKTQSPVPGPGEEVA